MCSLRFEHWYRCNATHRNRTLEYREQGIPYPCSGLWYELGQACADDMVDYLLEISYQREAMGYKPKDFMNHDVREPTSIYDYPDHATDGRTWTY